MTLKILFIAGFCFSSFLSIAQTTADKIKKLSTDSATKERAAKADVYVIKKSVFDPTLIGNDTTVVFKKTQTVNKVKKKCIKKKTSNCTAKKKVKTV